LILSNAFFYPKFIAMTKETLLQRLDHLNLQSKAKFGIFTPQHMVEHLTITLKLSAGRIPIPEIVPNEKQLARKQALLFTDIPFPQGIKAPGLPDTLLELRFPDLETAKTALITSWDAYHLVFQENPSLQTPHPGFGPLNYEEWELFHAKHIDHHLGQFGC
jgi:oxepin-CoA hydrolase/3-oxo-5,6-dehydrosuberyl-CoA semialdehyde dehydrogenase